MMNKQSYLAWPTLLITSTFFALAIVAGKLVNICFYLLVLLALLSLLVRRHVWVDFNAVCQRYWPLQLAMFSTLLAVLINQLSADHFSARLFDIPSYLALFALLFWFFLQVPAEKLTWIKWSWMVGVLYCTSQIVVLNKDLEGRPQITVWSTELAVLMGMFALISIGWKKPISKFVLIGQLMAGACGLYAAYFSESRGIWMALPVFMFLLYSVFDTQWLSAKKLLTLIIFTMLISMAFCTTDVASRRISEAREDIHQYTENINPDTSIGVRLQIWRGSWLLFKEHPLFGVGRAHYEDAMNELANKKIITPLAASMPHSHNEVLYNMMTLGIFGLAAILLTYLVPACYFIRELRHADRAIRASAAMGLCLCLGYIIFGLVDVMFMYKTTDVFYSLTLALLLSHIINRKQQLATAA